MTWNPNIPVDTNKVRGVSGDLVRIKENFQTLDPIVVSGLNGLSGVTIASPASGDVVRYDGAVWVNEALNLALLLDVDTSGVVSGQALTYNGSSWVAASPVQTLSGLTDTDVTGATSGQALTYDGSEWVPATPATALGELSDVDTSGAVSGEGLVYDGSGWVPGTVVTSGAVDRAMLALSGDQGFAQGVPATVTGMEPIANVGSWAVNPASGIIEVPSGVALVEVRAQAVWAAGTGNNERVLRLLMNGAAVPSGDMVDRCWSGDTFEPALHLVSWAIPVSGGEQFTLQCMQADTGSRNLLSSGQQTWFEVRVVSGTAGGAGGGGGGAFTPDYYAYMPDAPPVSGTAYDDEFTGLTVTGAGGVWTAWDPGVGDLGSATINEEMGPSGGMFMSLNVGNWAGIYQTCSALNGADFGFVTKLEVVRRGTAGDEAWVGIAFFDALSGNETTANFAVAGIYSLGNTTPAKMGLYELDNYQDATPTLRGNDESADWGAFQHGGIYMRLSWDVSTSAVLFTYSTDGRTWCELGQVNVGWVPTEVGIIGKKISGSSHQIRSGFVRMRESSNRALVLSGAHVGMQYA